MQSFARRHFLKAAIPAPAIFRAVANASQPSPKMSAWMRINTPLERYMADFKRTFDAWHDGGVRGIALGRMYFTQPDGTRIPTFP
ncbi:MAG: hypothetical protein GY953_44075, partial [bacterium]|nr:hypothetical protein [bacterium]